MAIDVQTVKEIRERTGAGMMDCKRALQACDGDAEKAVEELMKKGLAKAAKKSGRIAAEGIIGHYVHGGGRIAVLVEVNCETDFVARNEDFLLFVEDLSMHIAAMNPQYVSGDEIDEGDKAKQQEIFLAQAKESGKPEKVLGKIVEGKMRKWQEENSLLTQKSVKDTEKTIDLLLLPLNVNISNYPNPFNPATTFKFTLPQKKHISLKIYDIHGKHIKTLTDGIYEAGRYFLLWKGTDQRDRPLPSGTYFYQLTAGHAYWTRQTILLK